MRSGKFIIFSDQHKGARNGADDFALAEPNYLFALDYYNRNNFHFVSLGDNEELWENTLSQVKKHNGKTFQAEKKFIERLAFVKIFGNHDLYWQNDPFALLQLKNIYNTDVAVYEAVILAVTVRNQSLHIFCTHGHQGDSQSDGNWFTKFFVSNIWGPLQAYLRINPNTPAYNVEKKTLHNEIMYDWAAAQKDMLLITGHTHQPVFESLTLLEYLYKQLQAARRDKNNADIEELKKKIGYSERAFAAVAVDYLTMKPVYFNSGCCCYNDGDITGIEVDDGYIRLIKWTQKDERPQRFVLQQVLLEQLITGL